jgi:WD40 repeat protein/Tfp pilus assembly protein PilF
MSAEHRADDVVAGRYRVLHVLGRGSVGTTYEAVDLRTDQRVALKQLRLWHEHDWKILELFEREARVLAGLSHPGIPRYVESFRVEEAGVPPSFYLSQQLAPGESLGAWVRRGFRATESEARIVARQVLGTLQYLQTLTPPAIHRDIKPDNLIRTSEGQIYLVDFGAVRDTYRSVMGHGSTVVGTFGYMAPEQFRGQAGPATDLYGLGATLVFLLTQRSPSDLPHEKSRIAFRKAVKLSAAFARWLDRMLAPEPENRFSSAAEALRELEHPRARISPLRIAAGATAGVLALAPAFGFAVWKLKAARDAKRIPAAVASAAPSPPAPLRTGQLAWVKSFPGHWSAVLDVKFAPDGKSVLSASHDGTVKLWDVESGNALRTFGAQGKEMNAALFTPDGASIISAGKNGSVQVWGAADGALKRTLQERGPMLTTLDISADGKSLVGGSFDGKARVWEVETGRVARELVHPGKVYAVAYAQRGEVVVTGAQDGVIRIWDAAAGTPRGELRGHTKPVNEIAVAADGNTIASASDDRSVRIWVLKPAKQLHEFPAQKDEVWAAQFSPDGSKLASGCKDGTLALWDVYQGKVLDSTIAVARGVTAVAFHPDGARLAVGGGNQSVQIWRLRQPSWRPPPIRAPVARAEKKAPPDLREAERLQREADLILSSSESTERFADVQRRLDRARELEPNLPLIYNSLARMEFRRAYRKGQEYDPKGLERAGTLLDRAEALDPKLYEVHLQRAWLFLFQKDYPKARKRADEAEKLKPRDVRAQILFASLAKREKRFDEVMLHARAILEISDDPDHVADAYAALQEVYSERNEWDGVDEMYRSLINLRPESAWTKGNYAGFLNWRKDYDRAIEMAKAALAQADYGVGRATLAEAYAGKAVTLLRQGASHDEVEKYLELSRKTARGNAAYHYARGMLERAQGDESDARKELERALEIEPEHREAKLALGRL